MGIQGVLAAIMVLMCPIHAFPAEHPGCAATPEAAAREAIGSAGTSTLIANGYRVKDAELDSVMNTVWLRVLRCDAPEAPPVLVPLHVKLAGSTPDTNRNAAPHATRKLIEAQPGEAVKVFFVSSAIQVELAALADTQAAVNDPIDVTLKRRSDEPPHRMHGILRADHRVEVQP